MKNEKKIWLIEQYAHRTRTVSLVLTQEAARAGQNGKGYAVVASEASIFADKLFEYVAKVKFDDAGDDTFGSVLDFTIMMRFLAINASIEIHRTADISTDFNIPKSMAVFAEEIRRIAMGLNALSDNSVWQNPFIMPELASPSESAVSDSFFYYAIGGAPFIENLRNIKEVMYPHKADTEGKTFSVRGETVPLINCYKRFNLPYKRFNADRQTIMVVYAADGVCAVPIDDLDINAIFYSRVGCAVPPKTEHAFNDYARECWDVVGGEQVIFADWKKLRN